MISCLHELNDTEEEEEEEEEDKHDPLTCVALPQVKTQDCQTTPDNVKRIFFLGGGRDTVTGVRVSLFVLAKNHQNIASNQGTLRKTRQTS